MYVDIFQKMKVNFEVVSLNQLQYFYCMTSTWYGKSASKQLESLLETKPKLHQLLALPEFTQQLKAYNSKLIEYINNTPALISEAITYLTVNPQLFDTDDRKYKLPLQVIEMIETETPCILNGFFKQTETKNIINLDLLFAMLEQKQILPLLAGYFFRTNICLTNNRCKEVIDYVYSKPQIFNSLIVHSDHLVISNVLQLFLNLEMSKNPISLPQRITIKLDVIKVIVGKIESIKTLELSKGSLILENIVTIFIEIIDKYYLILDGKQMMDAITNKPTIKLMISLVRQKSQMAFPAIAFFIALINYCSFSSVNSGEPDQSEGAIKSIERLQSQPMMVQLLNLFQVAIDKISNCNKMDLYHYKLLEMLCHCISISSKRIFQKIREINLFKCFIDLLFKHQQNNVLHMLIQKSFHHVCISERKIYEQYRKHLFCELDIIDLTVNRISKMFREQKFMEEARKKAYFGHFMKIVKIYSKIELNDEEISAVFRRKAPLWNKIQSILIKPYDTICLKELGSYENVPTPTCQQYTVNKQTNITTNRQENSSTILQIQKQQQFPRSNSTTHSNKKDDKGQHNYLFDSEPVSLKIKIQPQPISKEEKDKNNTESFKQFMTKQKMEADKQIKLRKSMSQDKKLSNSSRGKMISPSPNKKNSWKEDKSEQKGSESVFPKIASNIPKVPINRHQNSTISDHIVPKERQNRFMQQQRKTSKSVNMEEIRKIKVHLIDPPQQKKYRKADEKDQMFLQFLGLSA